MRKLLTLAALAALFVSVPACNKKSSNAAKPSDPLEAQLMNVAGDGAQDCGHIAFKADNTPASECAMKANSEKKPFFVAYDLPGGENGEMITIAIAGKPDNLSFVQYNKAGWKQDGATTGELLENNTILKEKCPAGLRLANSGRVTCYPPQQMPQGMTSPHGAGGMSPNGNGMTMPGGANPHGGMDTLPGVANPHATPRTDLPKSHQSASPEAPAPNKAKT